MAKWGEGDPRWIVEERQDGRNVNSWHWSEKDVGDWFKRTLLSQLENTDVPGGEDSDLQAKDVTDYEGDCMVFNRKGKISFLLELKFTVNWTAMVGDKEIKGKAVVEDVDHDTSPDRATVKVTTEKNGGNHAKAREVAEAHIRPFIRAALKSVVQELREGHGVPQEKDGPGNAATQMSPKFGSLNYTIQWSIPADHIFGIFIDEGRMGAVTRSPAVVDAREGGTFSLLGGSVTGSFSNIEPHKRLAMKWRFESWPSGYYSTVELRFTPQESSCDMQLLHSGIIVQDVERAKAGWRENFWEPIQAMLGCGYSWKGGVH